LRSGLAVWEQESPHFREGRKSNLAQQSLVNQSNDFQIPRDDDVDLVANKQQLEKTIQSIKDSFNYVDDEIAAESIKITIQYSHY